MTTHWLQNCCCDLFVTGLIIFENRLKPDTATIVKQLMEADIRTIMLTGWLKNNKSAPHCVIVFKC